MMTNTERYEKASDVATGVTRANYHDESATYDEDPVQLLQDQLDANGITGEDVFNLIKLAAVSVLENSPGTESYTPQEDVARACGVTVSVYRESDGAGVGVQIDAHGTPERVNVHLNNQKLGIAATAG